MDVEALRDRAVQWGNAGAVVGLDVGKDEIVAISGKASSDYREIFDGVPSQHDGKDVSRVLRLPGFWRRKSDCHNTVDIVFTRDHAAPYESLLACVPEPVVASCFRAPSASTGRGNPRVLAAVGRERACGNGLSESERDWYEVHRRLAQGAQPEAVFAWLRKRCDKPNPSDYAQRTVEKAVAAREADRPPAK